jgi:hypothetical protein
MAKTTILTGTEGCETDDEKQRRVYKSRKRVYKSPYFAIGKIW